MNRHSDLPDDDEAATINANFLAGRTDQTGFWDEQGQPAPWPDDLDNWRPSSSDSISLDF